MPYNTRSMQGLKGLGSVSQEYKVKNRPLFRDEKYFQAAHLLLPLLPPGGGGRSPRTPSLQRARGRKFQRWVSHIITGLTRRQKTLYAPHVRPRPNQPQPTELRHILSTWDKVRSRNLRTRRR